MAQRIRPQQDLDQLITVETSLKQVKTLLDAGIGCIAYLRGLFSEEAFEDRKLLAPRPSPPRQSTSAATNAKEEKPSSVRIKKLKRGGSEEGDKLLNYLDLGATEAIEKGYLSQLVFAIYLDPNEPTNLVESYTFTFTYVTDSEGNQQPEMVVQNQLDGMTLASTSAYPWNQQPRRESDVKRQVQQMIKNLITSTQLLDELPRRRFLNVRLHYNDSVPIDYEPPYFRPLEESAPDYTLTTPIVSDAPDCSTLGSMQTGYHGVALHSVSIAHVLQTSYDDTITKEEATERNRLEAASRPVIWNAQALAETVTDSEDKIVTPEPLGFRDSTGNFLSLELVARAPDLSDLRKKVGLEEDEARRVLARGEMEESFLDSNLSDNENLRRAIAATNKPLPKSNEDVTQLDPIMNRQQSYRPPVPLFSQASQSNATLFAPDQSGGGASGNGMRNSAFDEIPEDVDMGIGDEFGDVQMSTKVQRSREDDRFASQPVIESQLLEFSQSGQKESNDTIMQESLTNNDNKNAQTPEEEPETFETESQSASKVNDENMNMKEQAAPRRAKVTARKESLDEDACECGDKDDDGQMICCSTCEGWRHISCHGYLRLDHQIPEDFICYRCRAKTASTESMFEATREGEIDHALADLKSLALFRRAVATVWKEGPLDSKQLSSRLEIDSSTAAQVLKRLKAEDFLVEPPPTRSKSGSQAQKKMKKAAFVVNKSDKEKKYKKATYFSPGEGAEKPLIAMLTASEEDYLSEDVDDDEVVTSPHTTARIPRLDRNSDQTNSTLFVDFHQLSPSDRRIAPTATAATAAAPLILVEATPSPSNPALPYSNSNPNRTTSSTTAAPLATIVEKEDNDEDPILSASSTTVQNQSKESHLPASIVPQIRSAAVAHDEEQVELEQEEEVALVTAEEAVETARQAHARQMIKERQVRGREGGESGVLALKNVSTSNVSMEIDPIPIVPRTSSKRTSPSTTMTANENVKGGGVNQVNEGELQERVTKRKKVSEASEIEV